MPIEDYESFEFTHGCTTKRVYRRGEGPGVLLLHELPGLSPETFRLGDFIVAEGYTVFIPLLFGSAGAEYGVGGAIGSLGKGCVRREFKLFAQRESSPITHFLRELGRHIFDELEGPGIGVIGMCLTGNFALSMLADEHVLAPVLSQPSLPFGVTNRARESLAVSEEELGCAKRRAEQGTKLLGLRFTGDTLFSHPRKFERLRKEFGDAFTGIEIDSSPGNLHGIKRSAHSVLTYDLVDEEGHPTREALKTVLAFLQESLQDEPATPTHRI